jgi:hypothetical protein
MEDNEEFPVVCNDDVEAPVGRGNENAEIGTVPEMLTGCVAGKLSTSTCSAEPEGCTAVTLPEIAPESTTTCPMTLSPVGKGVPIEIVLTVPARTLIVGGVVIVPPTARILRNFSPPQLPCISWLLVAVKCSFSSPEFPITLPKSDAQFPSTPVVESNDPSK